MWLHIVDIHNLCSPVYVSMLPSFVCCVVNAHGCGENFRKFIAYVYGLDAVCVCTHDADVAQKPVDDNAARRLVKAKPTLLYLWPIDAHNTLSGALAHFSQRWPSDRVARLRLSTRHTQFVKRRERRTEKKRTALSVDRVI